MAKLTKYEKETIILFSEGEDTAHIQTFNAGLRNRLAAFSKKYPDLCRLEKTYAQGGVSYGVKMPRVGTDTMTNLLIPLPPLAEQKRIVAKIEELLPYVDCYAAAYEKLEQFNAKFPEDMKKSILQYAIQGKLVEQRPE